MNTSLLEKSENSVRIIDTNKVLGILNRNVRTQEEVKAMGLGHCNFVCMRRIANKDVNQSSVVAKAQI